MKENKTTYFTSRVDIKDLVVIAKYLHERLDGMPSSASGICNKALSLLAELIKEQNFKEPETYSEALGWLTRAGITTLHSSGRGKENLIKAMQKENLSLEEFKSELTPSLKEAKPNKELLDQLEEIKDITTLKEK